MATVWILNLDAEFEMAWPKGYAPSNSQMSGVRRGVAQALGALGPDTMVASLDEVRSGKFAGASVHVWCPTPRVLEACKRGRVLCDTHCDFETIRAVNDRAFCAALASDFPNSRYVARAPEAAVEVGKQLELEGTNWLLKRAYGVAGRGQRRVRGGQVTLADRTWVEASLREGGLQIEPDVFIEAEFSLHGRVDAGGCFELGDACLIQQDETGQFLSAQPATKIELREDERTRLYAACRDVARALMERGYFGPFGVDAFRWRDGLGASHFRSLSEINARYTLGWCAGMRGR